MISGFTVLRKIGVYGLLHQNMLQGIFLVTKNLFYSSIKYLLPTNHYNCNYFTDNNDKALIKKWNTAVITIFWGGLHTNLSSFYNGGHYYTPFSGLRNLSSNDGSIVVRSFNLILNSSWINVGYLHNGVMESSSISCYG